MPCTLTERYNYQSFRREEFEPWMSFEQSPAVGTKSRSFPLWSLEAQQETDLATLLRQNLYTVVEFGSFT